MTYEWAHDARCTPYTPHQGLNILEKCCAMRYDDVHGEPRSQPAGIGVITCRQLDITSASNPGHLPRLSSVDGLLMAY